MVWPGQPDWQDSDLRVERDGEWDWNTKEVPSSSRLGVSLSPLAHYWQLQTGHTQYPLTSSEATDRAGEGWDLWYCSDLTSLYKTQARAARPWPGEVTGTEPLPPSGHGWLWGLCTLHWLHHWLLHCTEHSSPLFWLQSPGDLAGESCRVIYISNWDHIY